MMKVKVKKVKRNFIKNTENDEILNVGKELKQCLSDTDIPLLNRSSEWTNFVESMDTNTGLIGPVTFESFFDENSDFAVNEIGTFIFSGGFDRFIFIEKTH